MHTSLRVFVRSADAALCSSRADGSGQRYRGASSRDERQAPERQRERRTGGRRGREQEAVAGAVAGADARATDAGVAAAAVDACVAERVYEASEPVGRREGSQRGARFPRAAADARGHAEPAGLVLLAVWRAGRRQQALPVLHQDECAETADQSVVSRRQSFSNDNAPRHVSNSLSSTLTSVIRSIRRFASTHPRCLLWPLTQLIVYLLCSSCCTPLLVSNRLCCL